MPPEYKDLPAKPLVEAYLEVKWRVESFSDPTESLYIGALAGQLGSSFPYRERLPQANIPDEMVAHLVKYRFRPAPNEWPLIQAGPGIVSINFSSEYTWAAFRELSARTWTELDSSFKGVNAGRPPGVDALHLHYVNAVLLDDADPQSFLNNKLHTSVSLPAKLVEETPGPPTEVAIALSFPSKLDNTRCNLRIQTVKRDDAPAFAWELSAEVVDTPFLTQEAFLSWLDAAHRDLSSWFFGLVDGDLLEQFLGRT